MLRQSLLSSRELGDQKIQRFLRAGKIRWYENVVLHEEIKIEKKSKWTKLKDYANEINQRLMTQNPTNLGG